MIDLLIYAGVFLAGWVGRHYCQRFYAEDVAKADAKAKELGEKVEDYWNKM